MDIFEDIFRYGTYYNPAWDHYSTNYDDIGCDRCQRTGLLVCIGWKNYDICMKCMGELEDFIGRNYGPDDDN